MRDEITCESIVYVILISDHTNYSTYKISNEYTSVLCIVIDITLLFITPYIIVMRYFERIIFTTLDICLNKHINKKHHI